MAPTACLASDDAQVCSTECYTPWMIGKQAGRQLFPSVHCPTTYIHTHMQSSFFLPAGRKAKQGRLQQVKVGETASSSTVCNLGAQEEKHQGAVLLWHQTHYYCIRFLIDYVTDWLSGSIQIIYREGKEWPDLNNYIAWTTYER